MLKNPLQQYKRLEIEKRMYSPNALLLVSDVPNPHIPGKTREKRQFLLTVSSSLGKKEGDLLIITIKKFLENETNGQIAPEGTPCLQKG